MSCGKPDDLVIRGLDRHDRALVEEFVRLLKDPDDRKHKAFRDVIIGVLADRMDAQQQPEAADQLE
jgi:hypothetical protein